MTDLRDAIRATVAGEALSAAVMESAMEHILSGDASPAQIAALAVALRMRGETTEELAAAARVLRRRAVPLDLPVGERFLDTCGTGGDGAGTFNISTTSAFVVAACGVKVAKHGNRAVSSKSGSADVLEALGIALTPEPAEVVATLEDVGIAFLFAPRFHGAMRHAAPVRRELGLRTFFNLLGPLANPAGASHQILGVYDPARLTSIARVLSELGVKGAWVVHGEGGLDEVSPCGPTEVAVLADGEVSQRTVEPGDFGVEPVAIASLAGGDATENAAITKAVLDGEPGGPRAAVVVNAAAALCAAGETEDLRAAAERAAAAIDSGDARAVLERWVARGAR